MLNIIKPATPAFEFPQTSMYAVLYDKYEIDNLLQDFVDWNSFNSHVGDTGMHVTAILQAAWNQAAADINAHVGNTVIHVTQANKDTWDWDDVNLRQHIASTVRHVTQADKDRWDKVADAPDAGLSIVTLNPAALVLAGDTSTKFWASVGYATTVITGTYDSVQDITVYATGIPYSEVSNKYVYIYADTTMGTPIKVLPLPVKAYSLKGFAETGIVDMYNHIKEADKRAFLFYNNPDDPQACWLTFLGLNTFPFAALFPTAPEIHLQDASLARELVIESDPAKLNLYVQMDGVKLPLITNGVPEPIMIPYTTYISKATMFMLNGFDSFGANDAERLVNLNLLSQFIKFGRKPFIIDTLQMAYFDLMQALQSGLGGAFTIINNQYNQLLKTVDEIIFEGETVPLATINNQVEIPLVTKTSTGALSGPQFTQLDEDSRLLVPIFTAADAEAIPLLNGIRFTKNPTGVFAGSPWSVTYKNKAGTQSIVIAGTLAGVVTATMGGQSITLMDAAGDWEYSDPIFDPAIVFGLTENFYFDSQVGEHWANDTRIADTRVVNVPELWKLLDYTGGAAVKYTDPYHSDFSIITDMTQGDQSAYDFEMDLIMAQAPHAGLPAGTYIGSLIARGSQITFDTRDPVTGDLTSTLYKFNHGDSNVTEQLLGWQSHPLYYNGQTLTRHWIALRDDKDIQIILTSDLTRAIHGITVLNRTIFNIGIDPVVGKTLIADSNGTIGIVSAMTATQVTVTTLSVTFLGTNEPTLLLPAAANFAALPLTVAAAEAMYGRTPNIDDYTRVIHDEAVVAPDVPGVTTERYINAIDGSGNISWNNYIVLNTADYQEQIPAADSGKLLTGGPTVGTFGTSIDPAYFATAADLAAHIADAIKHITAAERTAWDGVVTDFTAHAADTDIHVTAAKQAAWNWAITDLAAHIANDVVHVTTAERIAWNGKQTQLTQVQLDAVNSGITAALIAAYNAHVTNGDIHVTAQQKSDWNTAIDNLDTTLNNHINNSTIHITAAERTAWNAKQAALTTAQLAAANSGITAAKVTSYDTINYIKDIVVAATTGVITVTLFASATCSIHILPGTTAVPGTWSGSGTSRIFTPTTPSTVLDADWVVRIA